MLRKLDIFVASMTGTALIVADEIVDVCKEKNIQPKILEIDNIEYDLLLHQKEPILIISSTYGQGDVPDGSRNFYDSLKTHSPNLEHIKFAVFGLGDMTYKDTFAFGGKKFDKLLLSLNAKRIGNAFYHDASEGTLPEEVGVKWFQKNIFSYIQNTQRQE